MQARHIIAVPLVATLGWATCADAQMMGPGGGMGGSTGFFSNNSIARSPFMGQVNMRTVATSWLNGLHAALAITPEQEAAWLAFANAVADEAADMQDFRTQMVQVAGATAPQRAALAEQFIAQRLESATAVSTSMTTLYAQLTPSQRAILDQGFAAACGPGGLFGG